jgi:uncharacterized protein YjbI with pentapeptide repeats
MEPVVRVIGKGKPLPIEKFTGPIATGRFAGSAFVDFRGAYAEGVDFSGLHFESFTTDGSTFIECDFSRCRFESGHLDHFRQSVFRGCRFDRSQLKKLLPGPSRFEGCSFEQMRLADWWPNSAEFVGCQFSGRFVGLYLAGAPQFPNDAPERLIPWRTQNEIRDNDFSRAELIFPDFRYGVELEANAWPSGPEYVYLDRWQERLIRAIAEVARWPHEADREAAMWFIRLHRVDGREHQAEILFRPLDFTPRPVPDRVWARLLPGFRAPLD